MSNSDISGTYRYQYQVLVVLSVLYLTWAWLGDLEFCYLALAWYHTVYQYLVALQ